MTAEPTEHLHHTLRLLHNAIDDLIGIRRTTIHTDTGPRIATRDSRYHELRQALPGEQGTRHGNTARSMPPLWIDAADWLTTVDTTTTDWTPHHTGDTPHRLHTLATHKWRPQDIPHMHTLIDTLTTWAHTADQLLDPPDHRTLELVAPCPACDARTVHRKDTAGEYVRTAALQVTAHGCTCQHCHTTWDPTYFHHLARVLGCDLPPGVLE